MSDLVRFKNKKTHTELAGTTIPSEITSDQLFAYRGPDKFAPVVPFHIYQQFMVNGYVPSTILLLAHDVVKHKEDYKETFEHILWNNTNIIMDNSLVELGEAVNVDMVEEACNIVNADIAVLPDAMGDGVVTLDLVGDAYESWMWKFRDIKLMALIHGKDLKEWLMCAEEMEKHFRTPWVGIPRICEKNDGVYTRTELIRYLDWIYPNRPKIHLFGFSDYIWQDLKAAQNQRVSSIDSAVPFRLGPNSNLLGEDAGPRGTWWDTAKFEPWMIEKANRINQIIGA